MRYIGVNLDKTNLVVCFLSTALRPSAMMRRKLIVGGWI